MALDSPAVFTARLVAACVAEEHRVKILEKDWATLGDFAFSSSYTPGQSDDTFFVAKVLVPVFGGAGDHAKSASLRRILFEAYT
eukprot:11660128-Heterocapsa_arctica.AAC.1